MGYRGILFDFDYTLGDSTGPITLGYQSGLTAMGWPSPTVEQVRPTIGYTLQEGYTMLTGDHDPGRQTEFFRHFQQAVGEPAIRRGDDAMITQTRLFPGAGELLSALREKGIAAGIVSTKLSSSIRAILARHGMGELVNVVVGWEDVTISKPDPQGLLWAVKRLGLTAGEVLFCGDTTIDAATAQAGGTDFCAVLNGTTPASAFSGCPCVHIAPDLEELKAWLDA